jgi:type IV pilus assembly protein PilC
MSIDAAMTRALARRQPRSVKQVMGKSVPPKTLCVFTRQWSALLSAGIPLTQSFDLLSQSTVGSQATRKAFAITLQSLKLSVSQGQSLHASFQMHPQVFVPLYCSLLQAGESAGILDKILDRLADTLEMSEALRAKMTQALIYPTSILAIAGLVLTVILIWVVPVFEEVFQSMGASLPWATQALVNASRLMPKWGGMLVLGLSLICIAVRKLYKGSPNFQAMAEHAMFAAPVLGPLRKSAINASWAQTVSALLQAGIPLTEALGPAAAATGSPYLVQLTRILLKHIEEGHSLSEAMSKSKLFAAITVQMCAIGEETGGLDTLLYRASRLLATDLHQQIGNLSTLLEPAIMVLLGLLIGGILIALYLPIFNLGQVF